MRVRFAATAQVQLAHIQAWITERADPATADRVVGQELDVLVPPD